MITNKNDVEVLIIFHRLNLIMKSVSKIISSTLNIDSKLVHYNEIKYDVFNCSPGLLVIDQTVIDKGNNTNVQKLSIKFPGVKILIITLDENWKLPGGLAERNDIEILNLWQSNPSLSKSLVVAVKNKLFGKMEYNDGRC